jgi:drug/metabolite transporter (DMT)-like permease
MASRSAPLQPPAVEPTPALIDINASAARDGSLSRFASVCILLIATLIWGTTFVATRLLIAGDRPALGPGTLVFCRFFIAALAFTPAILRSRRWRTPGLWRAGLELSFWLWCGYATQTVGLVYTTVSRSAFVTSLNVIFVPVLTALAGRRVGWLVWASAAAALAGAGLLSYDGSTPNVGDLWTLACAIVWAVYIFRLEAFAGRFDSAALTAVQLWGVALLAAGWAGGEVAAGGGWGAWSPAVVAGVLYLGLLATAVTTWLQAVGQRGLPGTHASLIFTTEPLFASAIALVWFGEQIGPKGVAGAAVILAAAVASQVVPALLDRRRLTRTSEPNARPARRAGRDR